MSSSGKVINIGGGAASGGSAVVEDPGLATGAKAKSMPYYVTPPSATAVDTDPDADDDGKKITTCLHNVFCSHTTAVRAVSVIAHFLIFRR